MSCKILHNNMCKMIHFNTITTIQTYVCMCFNTGLKAYIQKCWSLLLSRLRVTSRQILPLNLYALLLLKFFVCAIACIKFIIKMHIMD